MYNQHTRGMATTRHRSLFERGGRKAMRVKFLLKTDRDLAHTKRKISGKPDIHESKEKDSST